MRPCEAAAEISSHWRQRRLASARCVTGAMRVAVILVAGALVSSVGAVAQSEAPSIDPPIAPPEIIHRMVEQNQIRADHLRQYSSRRHYHVEFHGLGRSMTADMHVEASYSAAAGKNFQVIDESGSHLLLNHVLKKLLETEQADAKRHEAALIPANFDFTFQGNSSENGRRYYIFKVEPKVRSKLVYRGRVWIDAEDYAVARVEAEPAESPSFWIKSTEIRHSYAKNGEFWLPEENRSESKVRFGGTAVLTIDYGTYQFDQPRELSPTLAGEVATQ